MIKRILWGIATLLLFIPFCAAQDSLDVKRVELLHRISAEGRPEYIFPTNQFLRGDNDKRMPLDFAASGHLRYSFQYSPNSLVGYIYGASYQGIGLAYYTFLDKKEIGNPYAFYLFQGATLARLAPNLTFDLEWNFGLSGGWEVYNPYTNPNNGGVGSKFNAYLNLGISLNWALSRHLSMTTGLSLSHFSNGNTKYPNAGVNTGGARLGFIYYVGRNNPSYNSERTFMQTPSFLKHVSYDLLLFGAWRRRGVEIDEKLIGAKSIYPVCGFNFAPMFNFCYRFRAGLSLDGVWDASGNVYTEDYIIAIGDEDPGYTFYDAPFRKQVTLGLSVRAEYVMPFFSINIGIGNNFIYSRGDMRGFYQTLALKIALTRFSYLNIGYSLHDFQIPNSLMLGIGFRFNNKNRLVK